MNVTKLWQNPVALCSFLGAIWDYGLLSDKFTSPSSFFFGLGRNPRKQKGELPFLSKVMSCFEILDSKNILFSRSQYIAVNFLSFKFMH